MFYSNLTEDMLPLVSSLYIVMKHCKIVDGTLVNPKRHTSCCVPTDPLAFRVGVNNDRRPYSRASLPPTFRSSPMLNHPDLKRGEKEYIGSIARIYSAQQMIKLKQKQYNQLLLLEMEKGYNQFWKSQNWPIKALFITGSFFIHSHSLHSFLDF